MQSFLSILERILPEYSQHLITVIRYFSVVINRFGTV